MLTKILFVILLILVSLLPASFANPSPERLVVQQPEVKVALSNLLAETKQDATIEEKQIDPRAIILKDYLALHNSPLEDNAQDFIEAADLYGLDWKLVPAISGVESTFGKNIPGGYNGWGWGVYGDQTLYFSSWKDGIYTVSKGLRESYINKGLITPYQMNRAYATSSAWGWKVAFFISDIEQFEKDHPLSLQTQSESEIQTFQSSAELVLAP